MKKNLNNQHIILNQIRNIGDVILTFPVAGLLKSLYPQCKISLLGKNYTQDIVNCCENIDDFINWNELQTLNDQQMITTLADLKADIIIHFSNKPRIAKLAYQAKIKLRIGTNQRLYNWIYCNRWVTQARRNSLLHEAELNLKLLKPLGIKQKFKQYEIINHINFAPQLTIDNCLQKLLSPTKFNLIIHPGSNGHGREWPENNFIELLSLLPADKFNIFITGTDKEQTKFRKLINSNPHIINLIGTINLQQLTNFIHQADGLVAAGTGPLHMAAALGIKTLGLFTPRKGVNTRRWKPLGTNTHTISYNRPIYRTCIQCQDSLGCLCMQKITPEQVLKVINSWLPIN